MVTGAVAAIVYGEPRLTNDIDIVLDLSARDIGRLAGTFGSDAFYCPPAEVMAADIYVAGADPLHRWALERRRPIAVGDERVWIAPPEYVVLHKLGEDIYLAGLMADIRRLGLGKQWEAVEEVEP